MPACKGNRGAAQLLGSSLFAYAAGADVAVVEVRLRHTGSASCIKVMLCYAAAFALGSRISQLRAEPASGCNVLHAGADAAAGCSAAWRAQGRAGHGLGMVRAMHAATGLFPYAADC